jgi:hypothetical protein
MGDFITLTCPTCGGKLQITSDIERFACGHCGNEHIVKRGGGIISLAPVTESMNNIKAGVDKTASELAIKRLLEELPATIAKITIIKRQVVERGTHYLLYADRSPLGRALCKIVKARGVKLVRRGITETKIEASMDWFAKDDTRLSSKEYDLLIRQVSEYDRNFPLNGIEEIRKLETILVKKENELKQHQMIVDATFS